MSPGRKLGPYTVLAPIAAGGMGLVYRARDTKLDRDVALKVLPPGTASHPASLTLFESEAKAVAALSHPGILAIHDFGRIEGETFAVTELLQGETLRAAVTRGPLPPAKAVDVAALVADALAAAHAQGLVHRDLKPENVFLTRDGRVKVLDFGLAVRSGPVSGREETAEVPTDPLPDPSKGTPGTPAYMSPEQARGLAVDAASDQFALGVVLYEMLAGVRPFRGTSSAEVLSAVLRDEPVSLSEVVPGVPDAVRWIVERCLRKRPDERYDSTLDLARDLAACAARIRDGSFAPRPRRGGAAPSVRLVSAAAAAAVLLSVTLAGRHLGIDRSAARYHALLAEREFVRLTDRGMDAFSPAVSHHGHQVAFVRRLSPGSTDVFLKSVAGGASIDLTGDHPGEDREPAFSPDGSALAFRSERDGGGLYLVEVNGGAPRRLTSFGHDPSFYPDGRRLAFATAATRTPYARLGARSALWTVDSATGAVALLHEGDAMQPAVSPNGLRVAFWTVREGSARVDLATVPATRAVAGTSPVLVTDDVARDWSPAWSGDGRYLWFASDRGGTMNLWRVRIDEESGETLGAPEPLTVPARSAAPFRVSADGRTVVYQAGTSGFDLERLPLDPRGFPAGPSTTLLTDQEGIRDPALSPAGDLLAFSGRRASSGFSAVGNPPASSGRWTAEDLWVVGADGRGLRRVTGGPFDDRAPGFTADGRWLLFHSDRSGRSGLWRVRLDGGGLELLARAVGVHPCGALASPDGRLLVLDDLRRGAVVLPAHVPPVAARPEPLPPPGDGLRFEATSFSPDGRLLAGHAITGEETYAGVWLHDLASGRYERLTARGSFPRIVAGGRRLYFLRQSSVQEPATVALLDLETRREHDLFPAAPDVSVVAFAAAPDGSALYLVRERNRNDVWLMRIGVRS